MTPQQRRSDGVFAGRGRRAGLDCDTEALWLRSTKARAQPAKRVAHRLSLRSPELHRRPRTGISLKSNPAPPATSPSCGQHPLHHQAPRAGRDAPRQSLRRPPRQEIKNTIPPAGNVGERARRRHQSTRLSIRAVGAVDPVARSLRSPELHRRSEPAYH